ncbi:MAG: TolC family protein [Bacteroidetes bacterium]|nr:TolC family protein [Bacteroidota bacterium]
MEKNAGIYRTLSLFLFLLAITGSQKSSAQHLGGSRSKGDSTPVYRRAPVNKDSLVEETLVALALKGPQYTTTDPQIKIAEYNLQKARRAWLNLLTLSANYNDQTFAKPTTTTGNSPAYVYPKYFFGLTIPIGLFFSMGPDIKAAKQTVEVTRYAQESKARDLRADVLEKYKQYKNYGQLILLQNTIVDDDQTALTQVEKRFKDGTIGIEQFNQANKVYSTDLAQKMNLQLSQDIIKLEIEKLIGVRLETVIR